MSLIPYHSGDMMAGRHQKRHQPISYRFGRSPAMKIFIPGLPDCKFLLQLDAFKNLLFHKQAITGDLALGKQP